MTEQWTWSYSGASGAPVTDAGITSPFPTQAEAEAYLGEAWPELADAGVTAVTLLRDGECVYGPMSLGAEQ